MWTGDDDRRTGDDEDDGTGTRLVAAESLPVSQMPFKSPSKAWAACGFGTLEELEE